MQQDKQSVEEIVKEFDILRFAYLESALAKDGNDLNSKAENMKNFLRQALHQSRLNTLKEVGEWAEEKYDTDPENYGRLESEIWNTVIGDLQAHLEKLKEQA